MADEHQPDRFGNRVIILLGNRVIDVVVDAKPGRPGEARHLPETLDLGRRIIGHGPKPEKYGDESYGALLTAFPVKPLVWRTVVHPRVHPTPVDVGNVHILTCGRCFGAVDSPGGSGRFPERSGISLFRQKIGQVREMSRGIAALVLEWIFVPVNSNRRRRAKEIDATVLSQ